MSLRVHVLIAGALWAGLIFAIYFGIMAAFWPGPFGPDMIPH